MGHKGIAMTLRYSHLSPGYLKEAVETLRRRIIRGQTDTATDTGIKSTLAEEPQQRDNYPNFKNKFGAGDGIRTRDVQLGKLAFYH